MAKFGKQSTANKETCFLALQITAEDVVLDFDHSIRCGHRSEEDQQAAFDSGASKAKPGESKHNHNDEKGNPASLAVDAYPYPISGAEWAEFVRQGRDSKLFARFALIAGAYIAAGRSNGLLIRWGADWDGDGQELGDGFLDAPHLEVVGFVEGN